MPFEKLIEYFLKFPGIGPRQAKRFAYFLAGENTEFAKNLAELILQVKKEARQCPSCFRLYENGGNHGKCDICSNPNRNNSVLMVVEKNVDFENIEKSGAYNGKYFILGGAVSISNGNGQSADKLRMKELFNKAKKEKPEEIILATSATIEGENTARYLEKILEPLGAKITRLGRGLSTGTELEYIDSETMSNALKNRR